MSTHQLNNMHKSKQNNINRWILVFVLLVIATGEMVQTVASSPVCCVNFTTNEGTSVETFEDASQWTGFGVNTTNDLTHFKEGTQGVSVNASNGAQTDTVKTINQNFANTDLFTIWVWVQPVPNGYPSANISALRFHLSNDASFTNFYGLGTVTGSMLKEGWNKLVFSKAGASASGAPSWGSNMVRLRLRIIPVAGKDVNVTYDDMRVGYSARPKLIISFDDDNKSVYSEAFPVIKANNLRAQSFLVTDRIDGLDITSLDAFPSMTTAQITEMANSGWDMGSHTSEHYSLITGLSASNLTHQTNGSRDWLVQHGFARTSCCIAYPFGDYNNTVLDYTRPVFTIARSTFDSTYQPDYESSDGDNISLTMKILNVDTSNSPGFVKDRINATILRNGTSIMLFHRIVNGNPNASKGGIEYNTINFTQIMNYISIKKLDGSIDVITMSDLLIHNELYYSGNSTYPIYNTVYPNGTVFYNYDGLTYPVNGTIIPSVGSVNVSFSTYNSVSKTLTISSSIHNNPTTFTIGDFPANTYIQVNKNGVFSNTYLSNSYGYISFNQNTYSDVTIDAFVTTNLPTTLIELTTCPGVNSDINAAFGLIGVLLIVFAAGMLISGIRSMNYPFMIVGIGAAITGAIMIIVGYFITITISNGVGCLG